MTNYILIIIINFIKQLIYGFINKLNKLIILINSFNLLNVLTIFKSNSIINLNILMDISVTDLIWENNFIFDYKCKRFELIYSFWSSFYNKRIFVKYFVNGKLFLLSLKTLYSSSQWLEREVWDMFGLKFILHNDLRRILNDYGFKGFPLRKDFPLIGFIELFYDDVNQSIIIDAVEQMQSYRFFKFENPWQNWKV